MMQAGDNFLEALRDGKDGQGAEPPPMDEGNENGNVATFRRK